MPESEPKVDTARLKNGPEIRAMETMWRSVVAQAIRDLACQDVELALEAALWVGGEDFSEVCDLAGFDARWLENEIRAGLAMEEPYRKFHLIKLAGRLNTAMTLDLDRE